jgi:hypothetical protein
MAVPASFARDDQRPLLLVDVDGVVCPYAGELSDPAAEDLALITVGYTPLWLARGTPERLQRLRQSFQLVWCTAWEDQAAEFLAPLLGLPPLPVIRFDEPGDQDGDWKWPAIDAFAGEHPFAWIDDELGSRDFARAARRSVPTLLVRIYGPLGLAERHVEELEAFAATLR